MGWLCHPCITTLTSPISFLSLKLSPPPCAALCYEEWNLGNELQVAWVFITWVSGLSSAHSESDLRWEHTEGSAVAWGPQQNNDRAALCRVFSSSTGLQDPSCGDRSTSSHSSWQWGGIGLKLGWMCVSTRSQVYLRTLVFKPIMPTACIKRSRGLDNSCWSLTLVSEPPFQYLWHLSF